MGQLLLDFWGGLDGPILKLLQQAGFSGLVDLSGGEAVVIEQKLEETTRNRRQDRKLTEYDRSRLVRVVEHVDELLQVFGLPRLRWHTIDNIKDGVVQTTVKPTYMRQKGRGGRPAKEFTFGRIDNGPSENEPDDEPTDAELDALEKQIND